MKICTTILSLESKDLTEFTRCIKAKSPLAAANGLFYGNERILIRTFNNGKSAVSGCYYTLSTPLSGRTQQCVFVGVRMRFGFGERFEIGCL